MNDRPGYYQGQHYTTYVEQVKNLKCNGQLDQAERLLIKLLAAVEAENQVERNGVAPWYYKELVKIYRLRRDRAAESAIIARFNGQPYGTDELYGSILAGDAYALLGA